MKSNILLGLVVSISFATAAHPAQAAPAFPGPWAGEWKGQCTLSRPQRGEGTIAMALSVRALAPGKATWIMSYGAGAENETRPYEMTAANRALTHFVLDEKNGILIDTYRVGNVLRSQFEVQGSRISVREEVRENTMRVEMTTYSETPTRVSGGGGVPTVNAFELRATQNCELTR